MQNQLVHQNEKSYFAISVVISVIIYLFLIISIVGIFYIILGALFSIFFHGIMMGHIRNNGVKITKQQFGIIYNRVESLSRQMGIREVPDIFVVQSDGMLNAFATRLLGRNFIVLYSEIFDLIESNAEEELTFVIAHELAHIQRRHITKHWLILPAMWIPFLGNAYSRACEYTCDRFAAYYTGNPEAAMNGLTLLAIGKVLYKKVHRAEYLQQSRSETGFFTWLSHVLSSHPPLPLRILELERLTKYPQFYTYAPLADTAIDAQPVSGI
ncbi:M48 family metallopeptidase [Aneurinibacillus tyrosinisolvens]|uniref:M48 family metallopeptidase n=1 Tax=Aneurinibacillus tyrosinisolvens TaxID=1443435 RepID=UPI00063EF6AA|nr:M48 family metallopeptidase [Aneurinibacillus tyrosinisolvens]